MHEQLKAEYIQPQMDEVGMVMLVQASALISSYAEKGLMLNQPVETLLEMARMRNVVFAVHGGEVIGTIAVSYIWPDGKKELGAWAVKEEYRLHGVGIGLLKQLAIQLSHSPDGLGTIIAFANNNSGPIFKNLGATVLPQQLVHPDAFVPCQTCHCDKSCLTDGSQCVDTIFNLTPVMKKLVNQYGTQTL